MKYILIFCLLIGSAQAQSIVNKKLIPPTASQWDKYSKIDINTEGNYAKFRYKIPDTVAVKIRLQGKIIATKKIIWAKEWTKGDKDFTLTEYYYLLPNGNTFASRDIEEIK